MMLLAGCGGGPRIKHQVLTPPPSSPQSEFFVEKPEVQSREVGEEAWMRNEHYAQLLTGALTSALQIRGKTLAPPPAHRIRARVYLAYGAAPVKAKGSKRGKPHIEIRLQLVEPAGGSVRYSTHTYTPIQPRPLAGWFGDAQTADEIIRQALDAAARDFVSRL